MSKTRKADQRYLLPTVVDPDRVCFQIWIPDDNNHQRAFFAALHELTQNWVWKWDDDQPGQGAQVGAVWEQIISEAILDFVFAGGCMKCNYCYVDISNTINLYIENISTVNTWVDSFNTSGGVTVSSQVSNDIKYGQGHDAATDDQICLMIDLFIDAFCDAAFAAGEASTKSGLDRMGETLAAASGAFAAAALLLPPALAGAAAAAALSAAISALLSRIPLFEPPTELFAALADDEARREMKCCMFNVLSAPASILSWANWQGLFFGLVSCPIEGTSENGVILRSFFQGTISPSVELYVSFYRQLDELGFLAYADQLPLCVLCGDWCYNFNFTTSDESWQIWDVEPYGEYVADTGWQSTFSSNSERLFIVRDDDVAVANRVRLDWICSGTGTHSARRISVTLTRNGFEVYEASTTSIDFDADGEAGNHVFLPGDVEYDRIRVTFTSDSTSGFINMLVTYVEIEGPGINPYGADNC